MARKSKGPKQTPRERAQLRHHLRELDEQRDSRLLDLGGLALEMHRRDRFDADMLDAKAAEVAAVEDEAKLVRRGLDEGLPLERLEEIARNAD